VVTTELIIPFAGDAAGLTHTLTSVRPLSGRLRVLIKSTLDAKSLAESAVEAARADNVRVVASADLGIYDAWSQALAQSEADFVCFGGAGDVYDAPAFGRLLSIVDRVGSDPIDIFYGRVALVSPSGTLLEEHGGAPFVYSATWAGVRRRCPASPEALLRRERVVTIIPEIRDLRLAGDVWMFLLIWRTSNVFFHDEVVVRMLDGGRSTWPENALTVYRETAALARRLSDFAPLTYRVRFFLICATRTALSSAFGRRFANEVFDRLRMLSGRRRRLSVK
jgi:hypothetical protein